MCIRDSQYTHTHTPVIHESLSPQPSPLHSCFVHAGKRQYRAPKPWHGMTSEHVYTPSELPTDNTIHSCMYVILSKLACNISNLRLHTCLCLTTPLGLGFFSFQMPPYSHPQLWMTSTSQPSLSASPSPTVYIYMLAQISHTHRLIFVLHTHQRTCVHTNTTKPVTVKHLVKE